MAIPIKVKYWLNIVTGEIKKAHKDFPDSWAKYKPDSLYQPIGMFYKGTQLESELKDGIWYISRPNDFDVVIAVTIIYAATILEPYYFERIISGMVTESLLAEKYLLMPII